jgi:hypothetical protein
VLCFAVAVYFDVAGVDVDAAAGTDAR